MRWAGGYSSVPRSEIACKNTTIVAWADIIDAHQAVQQRAVPSTGIRKREKYAAAAEGNRSGF